jgi:hypothetical protein
VPITVIQQLEIPMDRAQSGQAILNHDGNDYGVAFEDPATSSSVMLLVPTKAGDKYGMRKQSS